MSWQRLWIAREGKRLRQESGEERSRHRGSQLAPFLFALHDCDVPVDGEIGEVLRSAPRLRPFHLERIDRRPFPQSQNHARIMSREIAAPGDFCTLAYQISGLIRNNRADAVRIRLLSDQP